MDQQTVDVAVERRALSNRADVRFLRLKEVLAICGNREVASTTQSKEVTSQNR